MIHERGDHSLNTKECSYQCISWTAIITGALVGIGLSFLLNLFSVAIGLTAFTTSKEGLTTLAIGGVIGMLIGGIAIMYTAGWVAGYLARPYCFNRQMGALYGFASWVVILVVSVVLASQLSDFTNASYYSMTNPKAMELKMTSNPEAPAIATKTKAKGETASQITVNAEKAARALGLSLLLTFIVFFVGALSSCFGGYFGLNPNAKLMKSSR